MIGPSIEIKGTVTGDEDLVVEGKVEGTIDLGNHQVTIGQSGRVTADVRAKVVNIDGEVAGDLAGGEKVVISKSGRVRGNIVAPRVTLEDGALFKGSIDMDPGEAETSKVSLASSKPAAAAKPAEDDVAPGLDLKSG
jgi:cytoskeletal protein CcmA (bactofilin family)